MVNWIEREKERRKRKMEGKGYKAWSSEASETDFFRENIIVHFNSSASLPLSS